MTQKFVQCSACGAPIGDIPTDEYEAYESHYCRTCAHEQIANQQYLLEQAQTALSRVESGLEMLSNTFLTGDQSETVQQMQTALAEGGF